MEYPVSFRGVAEETGYLGGGGRAENPTGSHGGGISEIVRGSGDGGGVGEEGEVERFG